MIALDSSLESMREINNVCPLIQSLCVPTKCWNCINSFKEWTKRSGVRSGYFSRCRLFFHVQTITGNYFIFLCRFTNTPLHISHVSHVIMYAYFTLFGQVTNIISSTIFPVFCWMITERSKYVGAVWSHAEKFREKLSNFYNKSNFLLCPPVFTHFTLLSHQHAAAAFFLTHWHSHIDIGCYWTIITFIEIWISAFFFSMSTNLFTQISIFDAETISYRPIARRHSIDLRCGIQQKHCI